MRLMVLEKNIKNCIWKKLNSEVLISFGIVVILYYPLFNGAIFAAFEKFVLPGKKQVDLALLVLQLIVLLISLWTGVQRKPTLSVSLYLGIAALYVCTILIYPQNQPILLGTYKKMFFFCIPILILTCALRDKDILMRQLSAGAYVILLCGFIYAIWGKIEGYSMWLGYQMLLPSMMLTLRFFKGNQRWRDGILLFVAIYFMLTKGSRGPLLILGLYIIIGFLFYYCGDNTQCLGRQDRWLLLSGRRIFSIERILAALFGMAILVILIVNIQSICAWLYDHLLERGIMVRTLRILGDGDLGLLYSSGRDSIAKYAMQAIIERPIFGYGLGGDCVYIGENLYHVAPVDAGGMYTHNFLLEIWMHFGLIVGSGLLFLFFWKIFTKWRSLAYVSIIRDLFLIIMIYCCIYFMISGTYLTDSILWLLLGLSISREKSNSDLCEIQKLKYR